MLGDTPTTVKPAPRKAFVTWAPRPPLAPVINAIFSAMGQDPPTDSSMHLASDGSPISGQFALERVAVQFLLPPRHYQRRDAVADHVHQPAEHAHKAVDAEDERHPRHRNGGNHRQRSD